MTHNVSHEKVRIAGGGIAGLSAAMFLQSNNISTVIYEKGSKIGESRHGDYEGLENWIFNDDIHSSFKNIGFEFNKIQSSPINSFFVHAPSEKPLRIQSKAPFFYLVSRGDNFNDLDHQLFLQCKKAGVEFNFGEMAPSSCDIIATGTRRASAYIQGINFNTKLKNQVHLLLGKKFAPKGYAYLIIQNGRGTIATAYKKVKNSEENFLENCIKYFKSMNINFFERKDFSSRGSFSIPIKALNSPITIGEAGGFQDYLFGFGMRMSMMSGMVAALKIKGENSNAKSLYRRINKKRKLSFINRILYERLNDKQMYFFAKKFSISNEPLLILKNSYKWSLKTIFRWINYRTRYEVHHT
ncbi:MAG: NAD(P)-binding protein [Candidatus Neomarinimicrobiota bacterium]|nr:NAD(P)-binding protein [Candidatus Neomarinimicrobiota bacterium]